MLYVFYNEIDTNQCAPAVLAQLDNPDVRAVPAGMDLFRFRNKFSRALLWLGFLLGIPLPFNFSKDFLRILKGVKQSDNVLIFGSSICISLRIAFPFCKYCKAGKKYRWIWDTILTPKDEAWLFDLKKYFDVWTFDILDAKKYGLTYKNTVCALLEKTMDEGFDCDVYFVGYDRGRYDFLNGLYESLTQMGLTCKFMVVRDEASPKAEKSVKLLNEGIPLKENYKNLERARAVLDIPTSGQNGLTQRTLEGLFLGRKVITSNVFAKEEKLFNEKDIFILGERQISELPTFIRSPFVPVDVAPYTINEWVKEFMA